MVVSTAGADLVGVGDGVIVGIGVALGFAVMVREGVIVISVSVLGESGALLGVQLDMIVSAITKKKINLVILFSQFQCYSGNHSKEIGIVLLPEL